jgi:hypothetical protein
LERAIQQFGKAFWVVPVRFGYEENLLPCFRIFSEKLPDPDLAVAAFITVRRVPVGYSPFKRLLEEELVGWNIEHRAQPEAGNRDSGFAKGPYRDLGRLGGFFAFGFRRR